MIRLIRNSFVEKIVKSNIFFLYFSDLIIQKFIWLLPYEEDWIFFKNFKIPKNSLILDIGAHWGESAITFAKYYPNNKIFSFEPNIDIFKKLKKNTRRLNIKTFNYGISNKKTMKLYFPYYKNRQLSLWGSQNLKNLKKRIKQYTYLDYKKIKFRVLKCSFKKLPYIKNNISIIKIDVEGAELEVLKNINKKNFKNNPLFFIEYNKNNFKKIFDFLKKKKYKAFGYYDYNFIEIKKLKNINLILNRNKKRTTNIIFKHD